MASSSGFSNLLRSQLPVDLDSPEPFWFGSELPDESPSPVPEVPEESSVNKERRKFSPIEDKILIGAWLNTSKDPIVGNDQKAGAFWRRIVDYYNANPHLVGKMPRETPSCKHRWSRINEQVGRFTGCYDAALRVQRSGQNDDDVMKAALDLFFVKYNNKFVMDHCWRELRYDQKWSSNYVPKEGGKEKRKQILEVDREPEARPIGIKAAKAASLKKKNPREVELSKLQGVLELKEKVSRNKVLERLLAKKEPLSEIQEKLVSKLLSEMSRCHGRRGEEVTGEEEKKSRG
ncbi:glutathione S-transferase T3-like [Raphanus sativus]|uniref:Glutathione S-transferase T3-like n=1 Tax=Raphanus sativus TaxID=3726 RepID=A0A6J0M426_RAPSA|nr:glutathione S-transferase T3-like [Raphanus sativus]